MGFLSEDINQDHEPILHVHVIIKKYYPDVKSLTKLYYELCSKTFFFKYMKDFENDQLLVVLMHE